MKHHILLSTFLISSLCISCARNRDGQSTYTTNTPAQGPEKIVIGEKVVFNSKTLQENRKLWIYAPTQTSVARASNQRYPVVYLLDGESQFYSTAGLIQQLSQANLNSILPEMIIVGIENTNRFRDLVPKKNASNPFVTFLNQELFQYVEENYPAAPYRILIGHSLGGLLTIDILTRQPEMFNAYIAIDPSLWYDGSYFLNQAISQLPKQSVNNRKLFVGIANTLPGQTTLQNIDNDNSAEAQPIRSILKLGDFFHKKPVTGIRYQQKFYENEGHNSAALLTQYDGLKFIFSYYHSRLREKDFQDSTSRVTTLLQEHYEMVSKELGYRAAPPEDFIQYLAQDAAGKNHVGKARSLYLFNIDNYPQSPAVYAAYANFLVARSDTATATQFFEQSLHLQEDPLVRQRLLNLSKKGMQLSETNLKEYTGEYFLEAYKILIELELKHGILIAIVPGQADSEFVPLTPDVFTVKGKQGYTVTFARASNGSVTGFTSVQPNGTFKAIKM